MRKLCCGLVTSALLWVTANALAADEGEQLSGLQGVWMTFGVVAKQPDGSTITPRDLDVAIRKTATGFEITWKDLSRRTAAWATTEFVATEPPHTFVASEAGMPSPAGEELRARLEGGHLVAFRSSGDTGRVARYDYSISGGRVKFSYILSLDAKPLESITAWLSRAKVVL